MLSMTTMTSSYATVICLRMVIKFALEEVTKKGLAACFNDNGLKIGLECIIEFKPEFKTGPMYC